MNKENVSGTLFALMAGATVGAGVGLLLAPQTGSQFRSSLREYTKKAKDQVNQASKDSVLSSAMGEAADGEGDVRSTQTDHTTGDTGQDN